MPKVEKEITVEAPADAVYAVWHNFENFPQFMQNIEDVRVVSGGRSHWKAKAPLGSHAEWDAEMTLDEPGKAIGWRSIDGKSSAVKTAGRVNFDDLGQQTRLRISLQYDAPAGPAGNLVAKIFSNPERQVDEDLRRFKATMERDWDASGMAHSRGRAQYGSSMGGTNDADLEHISAHNNAATTPVDIDDPAQR